MAEPLCDLSGGEIRAAPLAAILVEALRVRATGELRVDANGGTSRIYFRGGQPCGAQVFFGGFKPLGQFLLDLGWIDIDALDRSLAAVADGRKQGEALVALGHLTPDQLNKGLALHHQHHIKKLASVSEGTYSFHPLQDLPAWTDALRLAGHRAIVDALAAPPGSAVCQKILRRVPQPLGVRLRSGWDRYTSHFQLDAQEELFVASLEAPISISAALASRYLPDERGLALLAALHLMGILVPAPLGATGPWATPGPELPSTPGPVVLDSGEAHTVFDLEAPIFEPANGRGAAGRALELDLGPGLGNPAEVDWGAAVEAPASEGSGPLDPDVRAALEREQRQAQDDATRLRAERDKAARLAREEALRTPAPAFASDVNETRERRARMLQRAFGNILGPEAMRRRDPTPGPATEGVGYVVVSSDSDALVPWSAVPPPGDPAFERVVRERLDRIMDEDHFTRLGVKRTAGREEIKQAFFAAAKRFHPDRIPSAAVHLAPQLKEIFSAINESYQLLQDDERRKNYVAALNRPSEGTVVGNTREARSFEAEVAAAFKRRDFATAQAILKDAIAIEDRPDLRAHLLWARQSEKPHETPQIRAELEILSERHPKCVAAHYYLGVLARVAGETTRAEGFFNMALEIMPDHREARQELRLIELRKASNPHLRKR